jgi:hypothetical protein
VLVESRGAKGWVNPGSLSLPRQVHKVSVTHTAFPHFANYTHLKVSKTPDPSPPIHLSSLVFHTMLPEVVSGRDPTGEWLAPGRKSQTDLDQKINSFRLPHRLLLVKCFRLAACCCCLR